MPTLFAAWLPIPFGIDGVHSRFQHSHVWVPKRHTWTSSGWKDSSCKLPDSWYFWVNALHYTDLHRFRQISTDLHVYLCATLELRLVKPLSSSQKQRWEWISGPRSDILMAAPTKNTVKCCDFMVKKTCKTKVEHHLRINDGWRLLADVDSAWPQRSASPTLEMRHLTRNRGFSQRVDETAVVWTKPSGNLT